MLSIETGELGVNELLKFLLRGTLYNAIENKRDLGGRLVVDKVKLVVGDFAAPVKIDVAGKIFEIDLTVRQVRDW